MESDPNSVEWKRVATVEEFFDVIAAHHLLEDGSHLGIKKTLSKVLFADKHEKGKTFSS